MPDHLETESSIIADLLPITLTEVTLAERVAGLIIVDEVNGFATVGAGPLAPPAPEPQVSRMVAETDQLAHRFVSEGRPILAFLDSHEPGKQEPPYPRHCEAGSGEDDLVPKLAWLEKEPSVSFIRKDCINGFVGAIDPASGENRLVNWINHNQLDLVVVVGICTDICVMDLVLTLLSARNHGLMPSLRDIVVHEPACATYNLPKTTALAMGLPETAAHPRDATHHVGLYLMASRGAILTRSIG